MKKLFVLGFSLVFSFYVQAQDSRREAVESLLTSMQMDSMMESMYNQMQQSIMKNSPKLGKTPEEQALFDEHTKQLFDVMRTEMSMDKMRADIIDVYLKHYTEKEIADMLAFYESESGRSMLTKMPQVMSDTMQVSMKMAQNFLPKIEALSQEFNEKLETMRAEKANTQATEKN
ncbi:DUF2059 domain-containing protein [Pseudoalteromonas xiamenensis]